MIFASFRVTTDPFHEEKEKKQGRQTDLLVLGRKEGQTLAHIASTVQREGERERSNRER